MQAPETGCDLFPTQLWEPRLNMLTYPKSLLFLFCIFIGPHLLNPSIFIMKSVEMPFFRVDTRDYPIQNSTLIPQLCNSLFIYLPLCFFRRVTALNLNNIVNLCFFIILYYLLFPSYPKIWTQTSDCLTYHYIP